MRISKPEEIRNTLITFFANRSIVPIVGAGFSNSLKTPFGLVPNGKEYKNHMIECLVKSGKFSEDEIDELKNTNFSNLCDYYEDDENVPENERLQYLKDNFYRVSFEEDDIRKKFLKIDWPYIYTLNIDDAIENSSNYKTVILPNKEVRKEIFDEQQCLIKLHGDISEMVKYTRFSKIFTSKEYALSIEKNTWLLNKLKNDYANQNILFIGCSLADEIDLKTLTAIPLDYTVKDNLSKTIVFSKGIPNKLQQSRYKQYGITDIVYFNEYSEMYDYVYDIWEESKKIQRKELSQYNRLKIMNLKGTQVKENQEYFFWGKSLLNVKEQTISYPFYFISRNISSTIISKLNANKVQIISGGHISGKTYLLADIYRLVRDREVYYFDGKSRLSENSLNFLLETKNSVVLFDVGSLDRNQFERILLEAKKIHNNGNNFIVAVNRNDGDTLGLVKWKLKQNIISHTDIIQHGIENRFLASKGNDELTEINKLLPTVNLLPYANTRTILDQLIYSEERLNAKGKYVHKRMVIHSYKELSLLIILAIKEKMYSSDVINFSLELEMGDAIKKYNPFIEKTETVDYEKDNMDLSSIKYVLNSKYWLQRELGDFARQEKNYSVVADAYRYIIQKISQIAGADEFRKRRMCQNYIMFDIMNDIFLDKHKGNLKLILHIYERLHDLLATDFNFLHQKSKGNLNYSYSSKNTEEKIKYLKEAYQLAVVAESIVEGRYEERKNEYLGITLAHIQYTIATISSEKCGLTEYRNVDDIQRSIDAIEKALNSPSYYDDLRKDINKRGSHGILAFFKSIEKIKMSEISDVHQRKLEEVFNKHISSLE